jgi:large subunit ribosomal protein L13
LYSRRYLNTGLPLFKFAYIDAFNPIFQLLHTSNIEIPMNKTYLPSQDSTERNWYVVDATNQRLGRLASEIAMILRGKNKPHFTPFMDTGDFVIVVNAEKIAVTGKKRTQKLYRRHSGRPGGMKTETFAKLQGRIPERIIEHAVKGMLPKNTLGRQLFTKLKVYAGPNHPHQAQKPNVLEIKTIPGE